MMENRIFEKRVLFLSLVLFTVSCSTRPSSSVRCGREELVTIPLGHTTAYLLRGEKTILIDTGNPGDGEKILERFDKLGIPREEISLIILTHNNIDHAGSAAMLKEKLVVPLAVHEADAPNLRLGTNIGTARSAFGKVFAALTHVKTLTPCEPDFYLSDGMSLEAYGADAEIVHTPGHTPGSITLLLPSGEAIAGDLIFADFPFSVRKPGEPMFCDDPGLARESIRKLLNRSPKIIYVAHGGPFKPEDVNEYLEKKENKSD